MSTITFNEVGIDYIYINGVKFALKKDDMGTTIYYGGTWKRVLTDNDGDKYIYFEGKKMYFDLAKS